MHSVRVLLPNGYGKYHSFPDLEILISWINSLLDSCEMAISHVSLNIRMYVDCPSSLSFLDII